MKPRDETEADLLRQILAAPEDDAPRRVLADLLQGRGDPRGEYIALECDLFRHRFGPAYGNTWDDLSKRSRKLFNEGYEEWEGPFKSRGVGVVWFRGFPQIVLLSPEAFLEHGPALFEWNPIVHVHFRKTFAGTKAGAAVGGSALLARLQQVDVGEAHLDDDAAVALAASPHLRPSVFAAGQNATGARGIEALVSAPWMEGVEKLSLFRTPLSADSARAIAASTRLGKVRDLNLYHCDLDAKGAEALAAPRSLDAVEWLQLSENEIGAEGAAALAASTAWNSVTTLELARCRIQDAGAAALAGVAGFRSLTTLKLAANGIGAKGAAALGSSTALAKLRELDLSDNALDLAAITALAESTGLPALKHLGVGGARIGTGKWETWESDYDGVPTGGTNEIMESTERIQARFTKRTVKLY